MRFFIVTSILVGLCGTAPAQPASTCGDFSTYTNPQSGKSTCYLIETSWASWNEAEADCVQRGGHLASIHDDNLNSFLRNAARDAGIYDSFHIGLTDARFGSGFAWSDDSVLNYSNFGPGIPNINYGHCMYLQIQNLPGLSSGLWFNEQCDDYNLPYVCTKN
ncbi:hypothetical protein PRIPAC_94571 [Pristionchus pacificus]|uniref:C-type lectin n=1 Tax=Pristionchus pacificus TaxID=54126 RepID=H3E0J2_PRIPA|nr:hypothetical protein PRIPAC_98113 [Pristionchus pacificus]KAF8359576.1 hypothetical protein PRIPAC_94571 [Pristionchus pacificus]|eukprot:PDM65640.1 C-type lectin [Pristionchus pacificus]